MVGKAGNLILILGIPSIWKVHDENFKR